MTMPLQHTKLIQTGQSLSVEMFFAPEALSANPDQHGLLIRLPAQQRENPILLEVQLAALKHAQSAVNAEIQRIEKTLGLTR